MAILSHQETLVGTNSRGGGGIVKVVLATGGKLIAHARLHKETKVSVVIGNGGIDLTAVAQYSNLGIGHRTAFIVVHLAGKHDTVQPPLEAVKFLLSTPIGNPIAKLEGRVNGQLNVVAVAVDGSWYPLGLVGTKKNIVDGATRLDIDRIEIVCRTILLQIGRVNEVIAIKDRIHLIAEQDSHGMHKPDESDSSAAYY